MNPIRSALLLLGLAASACQSTAPRYDAEASTAFRAAWDKRRAGDEAGYRAGLAAVAAKKGSFAGDRAALDLEMIDEPHHTGSFEMMLRSAAQYFAKPEAPANDDAPPDLPSAP